MVHTLTGHTDSINSILYIPYTSYIVSGSDDFTMMVWDYETYELLHTV